jgi:hypothetical protein
MMAAVETITMKRSSSTGCSASMTCCSSRRCTSIHNMMEAAKDKCQGGSVALILRSTGSRIIGNSRGCVNLVDCQYLRRYKHGDVFDLFHGLCLLAAGKTVFFGTLLMLPR